MSNERLRFLGPAAVLILLIALTVALMVIGHGSGKSKDAPEAGTWGLSVQTLTPDFAARLGIPENHGAIVTRVAIDSPAARAGLRQGDVVLALNRRNVADAAAFWREMAEARTNEISLRIRRANSVVLISLDRRPSS